VLIPLKLAIIRSGLSQREIAAETQIPESRLSTIIRGWTSATKEERQAIQAAIECDRSVFDLETRGLRR
jgi:hypothetical protein